MPRSAFVSPSETTADERLAMTVLLCVPGLVRQAAPTGRSYQRPSAKPAVQFSLCPSCPSCLKKQRDDREAIAKRTQIVVRRVLNGFYRRTADYADGRRYGMDGRISYGPVRGDVFWIRHHAKREYVDCRASAFVSPSETTADETLAMTGLLLVVCMVRHAAPYLMSVSAAISVICGLILVVPVVSLWFEWFRFRFRSRFRRRGGNCETNPIYSNDE